MRVQLHCATRKSTPACNRGQARGQPTKEVVIFKPPSIKTKSTARELKLAKHLKASGARMCAALTFHTAPTASAEAVARMALSLHHRWRGCLEAGRFGPSPR